MASRNTEKVEEVRERGRLAVLIEFGRQLATLRRGEWGNLWGYVFIMPAVILFLVFQGYPLIRGFLMAFSDYRWLIPETQGLFDLNGLANFREMIHDPYFYSSFGIALKYTVLYLPLLIGISLFIAVLIFRVKDPLMAGIYRVIVYMPVVIPMSAAMLMWGQLYNSQYGFLNHILATVFRIEHPPLWLGSPKWTMIAVLIAHLWKSFGYDTLLFLIGMYNIDPTLYEVAVIDGAGSWQRFVHITLPLLKRTFTLVLVLTGGIVSATVPIMTMFEPGTSGGPGESMLTIGLYAYREAFVMGDMRMGYGAAINLVIGLISALFSGLIFRILRSEKD